MINPDWWLSRRLQIAAPIAPVG